MNQPSDATFAHQVDHLFGCVERLRAGGRNAGYFLFETMTALVGVQAAIARDNPRPEAVAAFRRRSAAELASLHQQIRSYARLVADQAATDEEGVLPVVCTRRSAIEIVRTEYAGTSVAEAIDPADIERLDDEIRRLAEEQGPVPPGEIISALPTSHWWWTYPRQPSRPPRSSDGAFAVAPLDPALLLPPDRIDYPSFDGERLLLLAIQGDEPFIATHALAELRLRGAAQARTAAESILTGDRADRHLRALAIACVFDGDVLPAMPTLLDVATRSDDPKVLAALMEGVLTRADVFTSASGERLVAALAAKASVVDPDGFTDAAAWAEFVDRFGDATAGSPTRPVREPPRKVEMITSTSEALSDAARRVAPASSPVAHAWQLIIRGIDIGWLDDAELTELEEHLRAGRDFGIEELLFASSGDQLRVSFLDDDVECERSELLEVMSSLLRRRSPTAGKPERLLERDDAGAPIALEQLAAARAPEAAAVLARRRPDGPASLPPLGRVLLELIAAHDGQWGWYQLDRYFSTRDSPPGRQLVESLAVLEAAGAIRDLAPPGEQPRYQLTDAGRATLQRDRAAVDSGARGPRGGGAA